MRAPPDRRRHHVCSPLAVGVDGARLCDAQGIDGLHDRRGDSAGGDQYSTFLLFAIPHDRFRIDIGDTLVDCGVDDRVDLAGAATWFYDRRGSSTGFNSGSDSALASLPLASAFGLTNYVGQLALALPKRIIPLHSHSVSARAGLAWRGVNCARGAVWSGTSLTQVSGSRGGRSEVA